MRSAPVLFITSTNLWVVVTVTNLWVVVTVTNLWVVVAVDFGQRGEKVTGVLGEVLKALQRSNTRMKDRDDD